MTKYIISTLLSFTLCFASASACDCIMHPVEKYIDTSKYIITVKVKKLINPDINEHSTKALLIITKSFKGSFLKSQEIETDSDESDCAFKFQMSKEYLLFGDFYDNKFFVYHCSHPDEKKYSKKSIRRIKKYLKV